MKYNIKTFENFINEKKEIKIYDKVKYHLESKKLMKKEEIIKLFETLMNYLKTEKLLSKEGIEIYDLIDSEFALTSEMLTDKGNTLLGNGNYEKWIKSGNYENPKKFFDKLK